MAPDLKRKVDASRAARQAREAVMKKQIDAQVKTSRLLSGQHFIGLSASLTLVGWFLSLRFT